MSNRTNITKFDPSFQISTSKLTEIFETTSKTPSAWNLQPWKFLSVVTPESKEKLLPIGYYQRQIVECSAAIAVLADTEYYRNFEKVYKPLVEESIITPEVKDIISNQVSKFKRNERDVEDSSLVNASLSAMSLILAAESHGFDTGIIGGFNKSQLIDQFNVDERYTPIVLVTIGKSRASANISKRLPTEDIVEWV